MDERVTIQKCRTCLKSSTKSFPLIKAVRGCSPKTTYWQILKEFAQIEYNMDYECHMPQNLCLLCCRQLRNTYVFIKQAQNCNLKLINVITKELDCLREQAIDLPDVQNAILASNNDNSDNQSSIAKDGCRSHESNLERNISLMGETILRNEQKLNHDLQDNLETDNNNSNIEIDENINALDSKEDENSLVGKTQNLESAESLLDAIQCPVCNKIIAMHDNILNHMRIQHDVTEAASFKILHTQKPLLKEQRFTCEKCPCNFNKEYEYLKHLKQKHKNSEATKLESIFRKKRAANKIIKCQSCDYTAKSYAALNYHNRSKHGTEDDKLKCKFCSYTSFKKCNLLVHVKNVHKELIKNLKSNVGSNTNESINSNIYNNLIDNFTRNDFLPTPVDEENSFDNTKYSSDDDLPLVHTKANMTHKVEIGQEKEEFSDEDFIRSILNIRKRSRKILSTKALARRCEECGNIYKNYKSLLAHQRSVHISEDKFSLCPHCGKKYKRKGDLRIHIEKAHALPKSDLKTAKQQPTSKVREKRFMCTECSYTCTTITILNIHINRHHTGEKPYKCDICLKSFIVPYDLKIHRYLHTGEKPYKCPICFKGFRDNSHMLKHKRIHTNERPYKCIDCGKSFTQSYNLSVHKRTHLKEKKLNCSICGKFFENKSMLNIHRINENHHDEVV